MECTEADRNNIDEVGNPLILGHRFPPGYGTDRGSCFSPRRAEDRKHPFGKSWRHGGIVLVGVVQEFTIANSSASFFTSNVFKG